MAQSDFASKLAEIYNAKLAIRDAIRAQGIPITADTPFAEYSDKILSISGNGRGDTEAIIALAGVNDSVAIGYIHPQTVDTNDVAEVICSVVAKDGFYVIFPPTNGFVMTENTEPGSLATPNEIVGITFLMLAFAERFKPLNSNRYDFNSDWVEFTEYGMYLRDREVENSGNFRDTTENGAYYSVSLPSKNTYGNLNSLSVRLEVSNG